MSVELNRPNQGSKPVVGTDSLGKKSGKPNGAASDGGNGFAAIMNFLTNDEDQPVNLVEGLPATRQDLLDNTTPLVRFDMALNSPASTLNEMDSPLAGPMADGAWAQGRAPWVVNGIPFAVPDAAKTVDGHSVAMGAALPGSVKRLAISVTKGGGASTVDGAMSQIPTNAAVSNGMAVDMNAVGAALPKTGEPLQIHAWLVHRNALQAEALSTAQQELKGRQEAALSPSAVSEADVAAVWTAGQGDVLARPTSRLGSRYAVGGEGSSLADGVFGGSTASINRSDSVFEIPSASAVVADTAVAETVSYWASHGVQTAELKLDGFGDAAVEVSILINGDQAQIDFRSDQIDVRQVLEGAATQLKELLSSQGLQLAGVSVGSFGKGGGSGDEPRQRHGTQQVKLVQAEPVSATTARAGNAAVGQSLDLFV